MRFHKFVELRAGSDNEVANFVNGLSVQVVLHFQWYSYNRYPTPLRPGFSTPVIS